MLETNEGAIADTDLTCHRQLERKRSCDAPVEVKLDQRFHQVIHAMRESETYPQHIELLLFRHGGERGELIRDCFQTDDGDAERLAGFGDFHVEHAPAVAYLGTLALGDRQYHADDPRLK